MRKPTLLALAATAALVATGAEAQRRGPGGAGMSARHGGGMSVRHGGATVRHGGTFNVRHSGGGHVNVRHGGGNVVVRHGGNNFRFHRSFRPGPHFQRRLHRGFFIHPFWFGPQFHINNWQLYGFANPGPDHRWVRYYDDAYLVDRGGRVVDTRYGMDWDSYGERWDEEDGIPSYYGRRDYHPGDEDYAWVEEQGGLDEELAYGDHPGAPYPGGPYPDGPYPGGPYPGPGYVESAPGAYGYGHGAYGYGYGYGYGWAYPIVIETTVTTGGTEIIEEVVEETVRRAPRRAVRRHCNCPRRAAPVRRPPPPAGERG